MSIVHFDLVFSFIHILLFLMMDNKRHWKVKTKDELFTSCYCIWQKRMVNVNNNDEKLSVISGNEGREKKRVYSFLLFPLWIVNFISFDIDSVSWCCKDNEEGKKKQNLKLELNWAKTIILLKCVQTSFNKSRLSKQMQFCVTFNPSSILALIQEN